MTDKTPPVHVVLVTGPSGAGRTTAINALEDIGFESIDNMPLSLAPRLKGILSIDSKPISSSALIN